MLTQCMTKTVSPLIGERRLCYKDPMRAAQWILPNTSSDNIIEREDGTSIIDSTGSVASTATTLASLSDTVIAAPAGGHLLIYDGVNSWDNYAITGDITVSSTGVVAIADLSIVNGDVAAAAAIAFSKLAALASGNILVGSAANVATSVAMSGDATISNTGVVSVSDLTIAGEVQGNVLFFDGSNWVRLANGVAGQSLLTQGAGANPTWGTPTLAGATVISNNCTLNDAGGNDAVLSFTTQTVGSPTLTVPDFANVDDTFAFITLAQTLTNKTLTSPVINTGDYNGGTVDSLTSFSIRSTGAAFDMLQATASVFSANRTLTWAMGDAARSITLGGNINITGDLSTVGDDSLTFNTGGATSVTLPTTGTLATLAGAETLTNKTIASFLQGPGLTVTAFAATDTMVGKATTDTFTNKTFDADGAGNVLSNVNANELDPITPGASTFGVPFILTYTLSNQAAAVNIFNVNAPFKFRIIRAWSVATSADGGTWKLNSGAGGGGTDITNAVTVAANDQDIDEPTDYDDSVWEIAANGSLSVVPDGAGILDVILYIQCIRVD